MKNSYTPVKKYVYDIPCFRNGKITQRVKTGLENALEVYPELARGHANETNNNKGNYSISKVFVVGSVARENRIDSDLDLLLVTPHLDIGSAKSMKVYLNLLFSMNLKKIEAVDMYVSPKEDDYPDRARINITPQVKNLVKRCNVRILRPAELDLLRRA